MYTGAKRGERPALIPSGGLLLDGLYGAGHRGDVAVLLLPPHPEFGGNMHVPLVAEAAVQLAGAGIACLRFDYHGVGASQGGLTRLDLVPRDGSAALAWLRENHPGATLLLAGHSFGAHVATQVLAAAGPGHALGLIAPPLFAYDFAAVAGLRCPVFALTGEHDPLCPPEDLEAFFIAQGLTGEPVVVEGADHDLLTGTVQAAREICQWAERCA